MYTETNDWNNLCITNIHFLLGAYKNTFYYADCIDEETTMIPHFHESLVELNKFGLYTTNSQPNIDEPAIKQISFLEFNCEQELAYKLLPKLMEQPDIYFSFHSKSENKPAWIDTFPTKRFCLTKESYFNEQNPTQIETREYTNWNKKLMIGADSSIRDSEIYCLAEQTFGKENPISKMLLESVNIIVSGKDFDSPIQIPILLLQIVNNIFDSDDNFKYKKLIGVNTINPIPNLNYEILGTPAKPQIIHNPWFATSSTKLNIS